MEAATVVSPERRPAGSGAIDIQGLEPRRPAPPPIEVIEHAHDEIFVVIWGLPEAEQERDLLVEEHPINFQTGVASMRNARQLDEPDWPLGGGPYGV